MLVHQGSDRSPGADRRLASSLAFVAGAVNAAGFYAIGFFSSHVTGNISAVAGNLVFGRLAQLGAFASIVIAFMAGAMISSLLINAGHRRRLAGAYALSILAEAVLFAVLGCADLLLSALHENSLMAVCLGFLMGLQNAVVTRISNARVRTTHVTGMVTDIGIELGHLVDVARGFRSGTEAALDGERLRLYAQTVISFFIGGLLGVFLYKDLGALLLGASAWLLILAIPAVLRRK